MPGSAEMDEDVLIDDLFEVIDDLRDDLHPQFGVRPYRVNTVLRTWSGRGVGEGTFRDNENELRLQSRIAVWDGYRFQLEACGLNDMGSIKLTEVSITYTYPELVGPDLAMNQQWMLKVYEAYGQEQPVRYFTHEKPPYADREQTMGWVLWLKHVNVPGDG